MIKLLNELLESLKPFFEFLRRINRYLDDSPYRNMGSSKIKKEYLDKEVYEEIESSCIRYLYEFEWRTIKLPVKIDKKYTQIIIHEQLFRKYNIEIVFRKHNFILVIKNLYISPKESLQESLFKYIKENTI